MTVILDPSSWIINMIVDVLSHKNTSVKIHVVEKLSKYNDWEIKIARMWTMQAETVLVVMGALVIIRKGAG